MSRKILIASHGKLASGIQSSIEVLTHQADAVCAIDAYVDASDWTKILAEFLNECKKEDEVVIFTDILGGSVFQKVCEMLEDHPAAMHVTGVNLGAIIETLLYPAALNRQVMQDIASTAASTLKLVELPKTADSAASDDDFFE